MEPGLAAIFQQVLSQCPVPTALHTATPAEVWPKLEQIRLVRAPGLLDTSVQMKHTPFGIVHLCTRDTCLLPAGTGHHLAR